MGWDDEIIVDRDAVPDHLECPICIEVVKDAVQCDNQHVFCRDCLSNPVIKRTGLCPTCRCVVTQPQPSRLARNLVSDLQGHCPNTDCNTRMKLGEIARHMTSVCELRPTQCPNHVHGCTTVVPFRHLPGHDRQCAHKLLLCEHAGCGALFRRASLYVHLNACEWRTVDCVNDGCNVEVPFKMMDTHVDSECKFARVKCVCGAFISKKDQSVHNASVCPKFVVSCGNAGCEHTCQRDSLRLHRNHDCPFEALPCPNSTCTQILPRKLIPKHRLQECIGELVYCHHGECRLEYLRSEHARHVGVCNYTSIDCPLNGCSAHILRKHIKKHSKECKYVVTQCQDCKWKMTRARLRDHAETCDEASVLCPLECGVTIPRKNVISHSAKCPEGPWICPNCSTQDTNSRRQYHACPELKTVVQELLAERQRCAELEAVLLCSTTFERATFFERACEQGNLNAVTALAVQGKLGGRLLKKECRARSLKSAMTNPNTYDIVRLMSTQCMVTDKHVIDMATELKVDKALLGLGFENDGKEESNSTAHENPSASKRVAAVPVPVDAMLFDRPLSERVCKDADGVYAVLVDDAWVYLVVCTDCGRAKPMGGGDVCFEFKNPKKNEKQPTYVCAQCDPASSVGGLGRAHVDVESCQQQ
eukprot:m.22050 g.22050  ORF g.22050 m.22050 type:complete len:646 (-) comp13670_c0_seq1:28-1965(-)